MNDSSAWTELAVQQLQRAAAAPALLETAEPFPLVAAPVGTPELTTSAPTPGAAPHRGAALHPRLQLALDELLDTEGGQAHNLAILVGRVRRVPARRRKDEAATPAETRAGRFQITDYGVREDLFRLEVQEIAGDALDSGVSSYSMELAISHRLLESGLFADGQRLAICGPLRMERSYDARFATSPIDPGRPDWTTRLEVLTMLPVDDATPDGSFVELIGVVEGEPRLRREPIGAGAFELFASVRLRCRRQLRSGIGRSRAVFSESTILPLEVPLSGVLEQAGALLRPGNTVHIHGRLLYYRYQLPLRAATTGRADRKGVPEVLDEIAASARARLEQRQPDADAQAFERVVRRAQQRFLTVIKPTIEVGYVELQHGTALSDTEIKTLIAEWRPRASGGQRAVRAEVALPEADQVAATLDAATLAAFSAEPPESAAPITAPVRPRRRPRADDTLASAGAQEHDGIGEQDDGDAA